MELHVTSFDAVLSTGEYDVAQCSAHDAELSVLQEELVLKPGQPNAW